MPGSLYGVKLCKVGEHEYTAFEEYRYRIPFHYCLERKGIWSQDRQYVVRKQATLLVRGQEDYKKVLDRYFKLGASLVITDLGNGRRVIAKRELHHKLPSRTEKT